MKAQNNNSNTNYQSAFFIIPSHITDLPGMTLGYLKLYETMFQFWNHNKICFLSEEALCQRTKLSRAQVYRGLAYFEKHNELIRRSINGQRYLVRPEKMIETDCAISKSKCLMDETIDVSSVRRATSHGRDHNIKNINSKNNNKNPIVDFGKSTEVKSSEINNADNEVLDIPDKIDKPPKDYKDDQLFMQFYNAYPNKQKPASAHRAFKKLKPNEAFVLMLVADIAKRQRNNWLGRDKSKIPHPSTYLNAREWEGEIYKKSTTSQVNTYPAYKQQTKTGLTIDSGYF